MAVSCRVQVQVRGVDKPWRLQKGKTHHAAWCLPPSVSEAASEKTNNSATLKLNSSASLNLTSFENSTGDAGRKDVNHDEKKISDSTQDVSDLGDLAAPRKQSGGLA